MISDSNFNTDNCLGLIGLKTILNGYDISY